ncbi:hypothetical protein KCP73_13305 [Salmonella enterica subsp. enterica]|nr:hypothetical protein KCP73_13305 [Salmonella enterica subsp. enterica]
MRVVLRRPAMNPGNKIRDPAGNIWLSSLIASLPTCSSFRPETSAERLLLPLRGRGYRAAVAVLIKCRSITRAGIGRMASSYGLWADCPDNHRRYLRL